MPIYEFRCPDGHAFSRWRGVAERNGLVDCPECGEAGKRAFISAPLTKVAGLASDRFKMRDKVLANRQAAHEKGML